MYLKNLLVALLTTVLVNCETHQIDDHLESHDNNLCQIEKELMSLKVLIANQDTTIARQDVRIAEMSLDNHKLHTEVSSLKQQLLNHQHGIEVQKSQLSKLQQTLQEFKNWTAADHGDEESQLQTAFSVHSSTSFSSSKLNDVLPFDVVEMNIGSGFDANVFTCPVTGLYYLQWSYFTSGGNQADVKLQVNGNVKRYTINHPRGISNLWISASNGIVIDLTKGDRVWLETTTSKTYFREWASFQGFLISSGH